jgi:hypothetical protein
MDIAYKFLGFERRQDRGKTLNEIIFSTSITRETYEILLCSYVLYLSFQWPQRLCLPLSPLPKLHPQISTVLDRSLFQNFIFQTLSVGAVKDFNATLWADVESHELGMGAERSYG